MQHQYVVTLRRDSEKYIDRISVGVCSFSLTVFVYAQLRSGHFSLFLTLSSALLLTGILLNAKRGQNTRNQQEHAPKGFPGTRYRNWLLLAGITWIGMPWLQWIAILLFVLAFLEYQARYPLEIGFSDDQVVVNTLFKKTLRWSAFNNVVLRDGLLTLDFKDNRLFQKEVLEDGEEDAGEEEFNEYCRGRLEKAGSVQGSR
ncbi:MAG: hypothetical protein P4L51_06720 [Puia sp.]|nr:hypothetical protein [Puia sp.]